MDTKELLNLFASNLLVIITTVTQLPAINILLLYLAENPYKRHLTLGLTFDMCSGGPKY